MTVSRPKLITRGGKDPIKTIVGHRATICRSQSTFNFTSTAFDILPGLKALGNNRAVAPRRVDISQTAATLAVVL
ncbi:MAG: hypothetical protein MGG11_05445 [Trichodesmium sp. MAG_R03]|nr:hypothetical protein [Trichodesmium sp. MAG_R03]